MGQTPSADLGGLTMLVLPAPLEEGPKMARVDDVAAAILQRQGQMSTWKLQKLVYYCQAWHLVWEENPLFDDPIQAWANGPVVRSLYDRHRGQFSVSSWRNGDASRLTPEESSTVDAVLG